MTASKEQAGYDECLEIWQFLLNTAEKQGHENKAGGISGYYGSHCGQFFCGDRGDDRMFQATGASGSFAFDFVKEVHFAGNITRMDVQTTIRPTEAGAKSLSQVAQWQRERWAAGKTKTCRKMAPLETPQGTETVYLGSPASDSRLAAYDAHARHPDRYQTEAQRYEARFRSRCTRDPYARLSAAKNLTKCCQQIVVGKLQKLGLREKWHSGIPPIEPMSGTVFTNDERRMAWLQNQVRKTAIELTLKGRGDEVAEALGCEQFIIRPEFLPQNTVAEIGRRLSKTGLR